MTNHTSLCAESDTFLIAENGTYLVAGNNLCFTTYFYLNTLKNNKKSLKKANKNGYFRDVKQGK